MKKIFASLFLLSSSLVISMDSGTHEAVPWIRTKEATQAGTTDLMYAATCNTLTKHAELLLECDADPNAQRTDGMTALMYAALNHNNSTAEALLKKYADPELYDQHGHTALIHAASVGNIKAIQLLLHYGARPSLKVQRPGNAYFCVPEKYESAVHALLDQVNKRNQGNSPLIPYEFRETMVEMMQQETTKS